jgi:hypothetical protein
MGASSDEKLADFTGEPPNPKPPLPCVDFSKKVAFLFK